MERMLSVVQSLTGAKELESPRLPKSAWQQLLVEHRNQTERAADVSD